MGSHRLRYFRPGTVRNSGLLLLGLHRPLNEAAVANGRARPRMSLWCILNEEGQVFGPPLAFYKHGYQETNSALFAGLLGVGTFGVLPGGAIPLPRRKGDADRPALRIHTFLATVAAKFLDPSVA